MAELDYIERRKLWDEVVKSKTNNPHLNEIQKQAHIHEHRAFQRMIIEQPSADVVKVVRCRDCVYCYPVGKNTCFCRNIDTPWFNSDFEVYMYANDYCSYGERRVEEGE